MEKNLAEGLGCSAIIVAAGIFFLLLGLAASLNK